MKVAFIGCVTSSLKLLSALCTLKGRGIEVVAVITKPASNINADFVDLAPFCQENAIPFHYENTDNREQSVAFLQRYQPDIIYCFGWSYLLDAKMLGLAPRGAIGFHPAPLPQGRGRHPIIWALALGLERTASTFFVMDSGADSGPILDQKWLAIAPEDDAGSLYDKILATACQQILAFSARLADGSATPVPQNPAQATYWRKRSAKDGLIDWRMQAADIHNLIRALTAPYPGAEFLYQGQAVKVWKSEIAQASYPQYMEPGRILAIEEKRVLVKCAGQSALWLCRCDFPAIPANGDCF
ncbi:methionyl-tRNA formyltransferase [Gallaecimonas xiamenensis]|uniref:Formyltransferase n=1 Tax=Gallaecimonas xiamenensis 3-C-1 TaxID=745411 RepID=K2JJD8_9GAMM|nr:formyltransferase family protein [Gallaecimonas xiamenensis]EKE75428.1 formyltransferase [Gallaecimonas xiamenensis 3-C-1]